ncbi:MAG TPA: carboxypeptidase-like regulatory domain-containing protein, partial [Flavisolibacter sp.]|nr:carboxypeptidase-like regulatory domain-containing protein [Flavisolibacter sp.]
MKMRIYLLLLSCLCFVFAWSQSRQVTGRVASDSSGEALSGVTVTIKGTKSATTTNNEAPYSISIPDRNNVVLIFSYVGFQAQEINAGSKGVIDILMKGQTTTLNDVVVIGYQTVRRKDLLSSVSSVTSKQLRDVPLNSAEEALAGRLAGVQVTGSEGSPDAQVLIRVRGG